MSTRQQRRATAADVALSSGVAKSTVSLTFNSPERVSGETRERVLRAAQTLGYSPNPVAQSLSTGRNNLVGLILQDLTNPHGGAVLQHVQRTAMASGYLVLTATSAAEDLRFIHKLEHINVRAAIIMPFASDDVFVNGLINSSIRFLTYGHKLATLSCDHVGLDNTAAVCLLVDHLVELGHRRIGHIAGDPAISTGAERLAGVCDSLARHRLEMDDRHLAFGYYDHDTAYSATRELLSIKDKPTALITANNVTGMAALRAVRSLGLRCPEDISIATVDQLPWNDLISPTLTCAVQPIDEMAALAATWVIERLNDENAEAAPRLQEFVPTLELGESTRHLAV